MIISKRRLKKLKKTQASRGIVVFRQNPMKRTIIFDSEFDWDESKQQLFLSLPYMFFGITYIIRKKKKKVKNEDKMVTTYRPTKLNVCFGVDPELKTAYKCALPNLYVDSSVCIDLPYKEFATVEDLAKEVVNCFWNSAFDPEELGLIYYGTKKTLADYKSWQKKTKSKPNWTPTEKDMLPIKNLDPSFEIKK